MRIDREDYKEAVNCLKRYNYNCINIINIKTDILSLSINPVDGMPKAPYIVGDTTLNKIIKLEDNKELQRSIKEYNVVNQALAIVDKMSKEIFEEEFRKGKYKWEVIEQLKTSEETYKRRKRSLIYAVNKEIKKLT